MAAPLDGEIAGLVHPRKNGSNVVVITSALHAVGRRFEPGIQYDSLFFAPRAGRFATSIADEFTRATRAAAARPALPVLGTIPETQETTLCPSA